MKFTQNLIQMNEEQNFLTLRRQTSLGLTDNEKIILARYPTLSSRKEPFLSLYDAAKERGLSLVVTDKRYGDNVSLRWLKMQLIDVLTILGAFQSVSEYQVITLARHIRAKYFYLNMAELTYFFEAFVDGSYGTMYVGKTVNPQNIMEALKLYDKDVIQERDRVYNEENQKRIEKELREEKEKSEKGLLGINAWLTYCKKSGRNGTKMPGLKMKKIKK